MKRTKQQKLIYYTNPRFYDKVISDLEDVEEKVASLLYHSEKCRNDDTILITEFWRRINGIKAILLPLQPEQRKILTSAESIRRTRQKLARFAKKHITEYPNLQFLLPTELEIIEKRDIKECAVREYVLKEVVSVA